MLDVLVHHNHVVDIDRLLCGVHGELSTVIKANTKSSRELADAMYMYKGMIFRDLNKHLYRGWQLTPLYQSVADQLDRAIKMHNFSGVPSGRRFPLFRVLFGRHAATYKQTAVGGRVHERSYLSFSFNEAIVHEFGHTETEMTVLVLDRPRGDYLYIDALRSPVLAQPRHKKSVWLHQCEIVLPRDTVLAVTHHEKPVDLLPDMLMGPCADGRKVDIRRRVVTVNVVHVRVT
jgi:hypothetical protein